MASFQNNFQNLRRFSSQLLESQAANEKPEQDSLEGYSKKSKQKLYFGRSSQKDSKKL
jgi:hypothetical protein